MTVRSLRGLLTSLMTAALLVGVSVAPAAALLPAPMAAGDALQDFGGCLSQRGGGDFLVLIDESGSLEENDPEDARVTAAEYLVDRIAETAQSGGFDIRAAVAAFSVDYEPVLGWTALDAPGVATVKESIASFAGRDDGLDTDYWNALEGARRALADRVAETGGEPRCQAVAWFSDGELDIELRDSAAERAAGADAKPYAPDADLTTGAGAEAAEDAARDSLCRDGGLADQLRASGVWVFGVGLAAGTSQDQDFALMQRAATGVEPGGTTCGALLEPTPGEFVLASDINDLLLAFDVIGSPLRPPISQDAAVCQGDVCADAHRFVLDASIGSVRVLASSDVPDVSAVLVGPDGTRVALARGANQQATASGAQLAWSWPAENTVNIELVQVDGAAGWSGPWSLVFVDESASSPDATSRSNIHISGDIVPTWSRPGDGSPVHVGETAGGFRLGLADTAGNPIDPASLLGAVQASAVLVPAGGGRVPIIEAATAEALAGDLALDLTDVPPGEAVVQLQLSVTTAAATLPDGTVIPGTELAPVRVDVPLTLLPPVDFPVVGDRVDFGIAEGPAELTATVPVTGPGCVWVEPGSHAVLASPQEAGDVSVAAPDATSADTCLEVAEGDQADLELRLVTAEAGNGSVNGTVAVMTAPLGEPDRATAAEVPFSADLRKPLNTTVAVVALVLALLLGPGIPLALLYLVKAATARIPPRALAARLIPVTVTPGGLLRDGAPFALRDDDLVNLVRLSARGARRVDVDGVTLRTRVGWSPFGAASVVVEAPGHVGASSVHPTPVGRAKQAQLPLAVHNTWVVLVDPATAAREAKVLLLVGGDASAEKRRELVQDLVHRAPSVIRTLRETGGDGAVASGTTTQGAGRPFDGASDDPFSSSAGQDTRSGGPGHAPDRSHHDPFDFSLGDDGRSR